MTALKPVSDRSDLPRTKILLEDKLEWREMGGQEAHEEAGERGGA